MKWKALAAFMVGVCLAVAGVYVYMKYAGLLDGMG